MGIATNQLNNTPGLGVAPPYAAAPGFATNQFTQPSAFTPNYLPAQHNLEQPKLDRSATKFLPEQNKTPKDNASSEPAKHSFLKGAFHDLVKTIPKVFFGSLYSDILKGVLKDSNFNLSNVIYNSFVEGAPSRIIADLFGAFSVRLFNGHTEILGKRIPAIASELASQFFSVPWVCFWRTLTSHENLNRKSAERNINDDAQGIKEALADTKFVKTVDAIGHWFDDTIKPGLDKFFQVVCGVKAPEPLLDEHGNPVLSKTTGKPKRSDAKVNFLQLGVLSGASLVGSFFLPRHTQTFGNEGIYNSFGIMKYVRSVTTMLVTNASRLATTIYQNAVGMYSNGHSFDSILKTSVREKMLIPISQYAVDAVGALLSRRIPINGATLSILIKIPFETMATFLSSGLVGLSKENRVPDNWKYLGNKFWLPVAKVIEKVATKPYKFVANTLMRPLGFFDKKFEHMLLPYDKKCELNNDMEAKFGDKYFFGTAAMLLTSALKLPMDVVRTFNESNWRRDKHDHHLAEQQANGERLAEETQQEPSVGELSEANGFMEFPQEHVLHPERLESEQVEQQPVAEEQKAA